MSLCTIIIQNDHIAMAADTALSAEIDGKTYRVSNQGKKLFQFGNEIVFCSGTVACVNALIPLIEMKDMRIDRQKLSATLRQMIPENLRKRKYSREALTGALVIIGGVINGSPYLWSISEENDFIPELMKVDYNVTWRGFRAEEAVAMKATPTQFINLINGNLSDFLIETYQRLICPEVGGCIDAFEVDKIGKVKQFMSRYDMQDNTPIHDTLKEQEKIDIQIRDMQSLPIVHAIIQAMGGDVGGWKIESSGIVHDSANFKVHILTGESTNKDFIVVHNKINNSYPFYVRSDGFMHAANANITGTITATTLTAIQSGKISSWNFNSEAIYKGSATIGASNGMYFGNDGLSIKNQFIVNSAGALTANGANITGAINATSLTAKEVYKIYVPSGNTRVEEAVIKAIKFDSQNRSFNIGFVNYVGAYVPRIDFSRSNTGQSGSVRIQGSQIALSSEIDTSITGNGDIVFNAMLGGNYPSHTIQFIRGGETYLLMNSDSKGAFLRSPITYDRIYDKAPNMFISQEGTIGRSTSSSRRYKHDIDTLGIEEVSALYNLPIRKFKYNNDYLSTDSERYDKAIPGFIAEEVDEILPIAVDHLDDGRAEMWNVNVIVPCLLKLIQENRKEIESLKAELRQYSLKK